MSDRSLELFKQASAKAYRLCQENNHNVTEIDSIWVSVMAKTLAELVVQECAHIAAENQAEDTGWDISEIIKEHFGVDNES